MKVWIERIVRRWIAAVLALLPGWLGVHGPARPAGERARHPDVTREERAPAPAPAKPAKPAPPAGPAGELPPDPTHWRYWWRFNHEPYLGLRAGVFDVSPLTGSDGFFLGLGESTFGPPNNPATASGPSSPGASSPAGPRNHPASSAGPPVPAAALPPARDAREAEFIDWREHARSGEWHERDVERLFRACRRRADETPSAMFFRFWGDNPFELTAQDAHSTFALDVDTASWALARRYLADGYVPPKEMVRTEEFLNAFAPDLAPPAEGALGIDLELAPSLFGDPGAGHLMLRVGVRAKDVARAARGPLALTLVVDSSGSMREGQRLELVKHALRLLALELDARDRVALVGFSQAAWTLLEPTSGSDRAAIERALGGLRPLQSTNVEAGLQLGYSKALAMASEGRTSHVLLFSDGVANVGQRDAEGILASVAVAREAGVYLSTVGVGMGNHDDVLLEQLANRGDGTCRYVDSPREAERRLVDEVMSVLHPVARDAKVQVEFDATQVRSWRLLGYENRAVADRDFRDDAVDAGEVCAGQQVTALYELEPTGTPARAPLAIARLRYLPPFGRGEAGGAGDAPGRATEIAAGIGASAAKSDFQGASPGYRRAVLVAQFAEVLRRSYHARADSYGELLAAAERLERELEDPELGELVALMHRADRLVREHVAYAHDFERAVDTARANAWLRARVEALHGAEDAELLRSLERENARLEGAVRALLERRAMGH